MSSVSVFAFIDKQGICTENQKYVDELAMLDPKENIINLDLTHQADNIPDKEVDVYSFEGQLKDFNEKLKNPSALSLAIMLTRNPREDDSALHLKEVFMTQD